MARIGPGEFGSDDTSGSDTTETDQEDRKNTQSTETETQQPTQDTDATSSEGTTATETETTDRTNRLTDDPLSTIGNAVTEGVDRARDFVDNQREQQTETDTSDTGSDTTDARSEEPQQPVDRQQPDTERPGAGAVRDELLDQADTGESDTTDTESEPTQPVDQQQSDSSGPVDRLQDVVDEGVDRAQDIGRDVREEVREEDIDSISDVAGEATERATGTEPTQPVDQQQPTESGQQEPPNKFKGEDFADVVPVEEGTESLGVAGLTAGQIATKYPELYDDPREVVLSSDGPPSIGTNIVETELNVPVGGYRFDPSNPTARERWLESRDERQEYQERYSEQKEAEENLGVRDGEIAIEAPDPFQNRELLSQDIELPAETEQPRQATRELFADRLTRATVEDLAFEPGEITLEETEQGFRPTLSEAAREDLAEYQQTGYRQRFREEYATLIDTRNPNADIGTGDIRIEETEQGLQPRLAPSGEAKLQEVERERQRLIAAQEVEQQIDGVDVEAEDIALFGAEGGGLAPTLTQDIEAEIRQVQRERAAESFSEQFEGRDFSAADITFEGGEATLTESVEQDIQEQRREQAAEEFSDQFGTDIQPSEIELTGEGPQLTEGTQALVEDLQTSRGAESLESEIEAALTRDSAFDPAQPDQATIPDLNLTGADVTRTATGLTLSESGQEKVEETELAAAREQIEQQVPITLSDADIERRDGTITLSEQGRQKLTDYQQTRATQQLLQDLRAETGADLDESDIDVTATEDDGQISFSAELTESGQRELAGEQVPGSDLPVIGGGLEAGGEFGEGINQRRLELGDEITDRLPDVDVPEVPTPSREQVAGAAAFGVAAPEPVTSATGGVILGGITLGSLTVAGAQRLGERLPDQAQASVTQEEIPVPTDGTTRDLTEITIPTGGDFLPTEEQPTTGDAVPQRELPVGQGLQDITELSIPSQFEQVDPRTLQTGATVGESITDDTPFSPGPTLPTPGDMGEEIADRQTFERTFPTGGSAVVGREVGEDVTQPDIGEPTEPEVTQPTEPGVGTGTGTLPGAGPTTGVGGDTAGAGDGAQARPFESVVPGVTADIDALATATPAVADTSATETPFDVRQPSFPEELAQPEQPGYPEQYGTVEKTVSRRRPRIPDIDLDTNGDEDESPLFGGVVERYTVPFLDPLQGDGQDDNNGQ